MVSKPGTPAEQVSTLEEKANEVKVYFKSGDYNVNMTLSKKDDDHANDDVLGMFEAKATPLPSPAPTHPASGSRPDSKQSKDEWAARKSAYKRSKTGAAKLTFSKSTWLLQNSPLVRAS